MVVQNPNTKIVKGNYIFINNKKQNIFNIIIIICCKVQIYSKNHSNDSQT